MSDNTRSGAGVWRLPEDDGNRVIGGLLLVLLLRVGVRVQDDAGLSEEDTGGVKKTYNWSG